MGVLPLDTIKSLCFNNQNNVDRETTLTCLIQLLQLCQKQIKVQVMSQAVQNFKMQL